MSLCFWFFHLTRGMEKYWSISRPKLSGSIPLACNSDIFVTKPKIIWSLVTPFTVVVSIRFYKGASLMRKLRKFWMITILVLVVDIYLVMLSHRRFSVLVTSGQLYSMIVLLLSEFVMHARFFTVKQDYQLHHCILSLFLDHFQNGASILWHVTLPRSGAWVYYCRHGLFYEMGRGHAYIKQQRWGGCSFFLQPCGCMVWCTTSYSYRSWFSFSQPYDDWIDCQVRTFTW